MADLAEGDQLIFVGGRGLYSFKGTAWRREGTFDRIQIAQADRTFQLTEEQHRRVDELALDGAPELELALFTLPKDSGFVPEEPWRLELLVEGRAAAASRHTRPSPRPMRCPSATSLDLRRRPPSAAGRSGSRCGPSRRSTSRCSSRRC